jgi:radical SAM superfamily enzyme YgiQ (UPF0313 family)
MNGLIVGDNFYQTPRNAIGRANGAHRIATVLRRKEVQVNVIDFFNAWTISELEQYIDRYSNLNFLGISIGISRPDTKLVNALITITKQRFPGIKIIVGGSDVLKNKYKKVDLYFKGFAEGAIDNLIEYLKTGEFNSKYIQDIKTHDNKSVVDCNLHFKNFDLTNFKTEYTEQDFIKHNEALTLETSRGCIFKCDFCNFPFTGKKKNEYIREKEDVKRELIENYEKYKTTRYLITDDTFNDNTVKVDMMYEISQEIDFKLEFMCYARIDLLHAKQDQLKKMIDFGVKGMFFGIESLKDSTSKKISKGFSGNRLKTYLLEIRNQYPDLHVTASFILGLPDESLEEFTNNIQWVIDNNAADSIPIFPLAIPVDNKTNYISEFTKNWQSYDYEEMTKEEIGSYENFNFPWMGSADDYLKHFIPWKNKYMNVIDANLYKEKIQKSIEDNTSQVGWWGFARAFDSDNLQKHLHTTKSNYDYHEQIKSVADFISQYKVKKLNSI